MSEKPCKMAATRGSSAKSARKPWGRRRSSRRRLPKFAARHFLRPSSGLLRSRGAEIAAISPHGSLRPRTSRQHPITALERSGKKLLSKVFGRFYDLVSEHYNTGDPGDRQGEVFARGLARHWNPIMDGTAVAVRSIAD